jgi:eukaryotic-like serine/threonine-protein kinase
VSEEGRLVAGRYRLTEQIGRGGMGTVWRAEDEALGRQIALKRLRVGPHLSHDELATLFERTRREARSAARILHPNVVVVHDVVDDDGLPCVVMEYLPAITLTELLRDSLTIPPEEAVRIGLGVVAALRAAHAVGVLHRDVKPSNVMLGAEGRVVLTDFGIATTAGTSTLTRTGEMVGSIDYMAPERVRGLKPGPASDLWSLGATLYQAVEGHPPFRRDTAVATGYAIATEPLEPMKQAGPLEPLIEALLSKNPDERPSAEQTEQELRGGRPRESTVPLPLTSSLADSGGDSQTPGGRATDREPVPPVPPGAPGAPAPTAGGGERRRRRKSRVPLSIAVAVVAVATAVAATVYTLSTRDTGTPDTGAQENPGATGPSYTPPPVPDGYHQVSEKELGVSLPVPDGWRVSSRTAEQVKYIDESELVELTIGIVEPAGTHPMAHFRDVEANTQLNYPTYRRLRMVRTTFRGQPAAVWEFTFEGRARTFRAIDLGFGREGGREYDVYVSAPDAEWDTYRPVFDTVTDGLTTTGS